VQDTKLSNQLKQYVWDKLYVWGNVKCAQNFSLNTWR